MKHILVIFLLFANQITYALPKTVIILRHGEETNDEKNPNLSAKGEARAKALSYLFKRGQSLEQYTHPSFLFAAGQKKSTSSLRSFQTLVPLSQELNLQINASFEKDQTQKLAQLLLTNKQYDQKVIMIAWSHKFIKDLVKSLGYSKAKDWPSKTFDRLWVLNYNGQKNIKFQDLPQKLFPDDSRR